MSTALVVQDMTKSFGANNVLRGVSIDIAAGEVLALMGANGAGKSTLIKILSGAYSEYGGVILIDGEPVLINSPLDSKAYGIETVYQKIDDGIIAGLSVAENLLFEQIARREISGFASLKSLLPRAREVAHALSLEWDDATLRKDVFELGIADKQLLILARALSRKPRLLILDEPTSALSQVESKRLFEVVQHLRESGVAILYVSHRLGEIDALADRVVVLRDGKIRSEQSPPFKWDQALKDMLGEEVMRELQTISERRGDATILSCRNILLFAEGQPFDIDIRQGEVTGVIGLLGSGKSELARGIFGAEPFVSGEMLLSGQPYIPKYPGDAVIRDVFLVSEDRGAEAILDDWSIANTSTLPFLSSISRRGLLNFTAEEEAGESVIKDFGVVAHSGKATLDSLSGGNQQKMIVGRWLRRLPKLLLLDEPFRGVDIGARRDISRRIRELSQKNAAVVVFSSDIDEILEVADRICVLVEGSVRLDKYSTETTHDEIVQKMSEVV
ncbi:ribose import ATP-binding protein RbsA [mine drainage metagenome]|uniref:Autoinducer 2 import ATP-binding protein LsrA n=1 Tax=mine drainage metagenome TaxID=410659 RepID=A0A1J5Q003_9ZZZZ